MQELMRRARVVLARMGWTLLLLCGIPISFVCMVALLCYVAWVSRKTGCPCCARGDDDGGWSEVDTSVQPSAVEAS